MRLLVSVLIFVLHITISFGQTPICKTEVIIIGTIHTGNKHFNYKTLYNTLKQLDPDIILKEQSKKYKRVFGLKTANFLKIAKPSIETLALQMYSKHNRNIKIFPYDTSFISRRGYIKKFLKFKQVFFNTLNTANMNYVDSNQYADYANKRNHYYEFIANANLVRINKSDVINMARTLQAMEQNYILALGKKYVKDSLVVSQFEDDLIFWVARNNYMIRQIKTYSNKFAGQRIIILTGLSHKYYLQDKLLEDDNKTIQLIELNDD